MTKKSFKTPFDSLLGDGEKKYKIKLDSKEVRATFIINSVHLEKLKAIAFWENQLIKNVLSNALTEYLAHYEAKNGEVQLPKTKP